MPTGISLSQGEMQRKSGINLQTGHIWEFHWVKRLNPWSFPSSSLHFSYFDCFVSTRGPYSLSVGMCFLLYLFIPLFFFCNKWRQTPYKEQLIIHSNAVKVPKQLLCSSSLQVPRQTQNRMFFYVPQQWNLFFHPLRPLYSIREFSLNFFFSPW